MHLDSSLLSKSNLFKVLYICLFYLFVEPYSIRIVDQGVSANYLFVFFPIICLLIKKQMNWPPKSVLFFLGALTSLFIYGLIFQVESQSFFLRQSASFLIFISVFSLMFAKIDFDMVHAFKIAIIIWSLHQGGGVVFAYITLDGNNLEMYAKGVFGSQRIGFIYMMGLWILATTKVQNNTFKILKFILLFIILSALFMTFSRSSIVGLLASTITYFVYFAFHLYKNSSSLKIALLKFITKILYLLLLLTLINLFFYGAVNYYKNTIFKLLFSTQAELSQNADLMKLSSENGHSGGVYVLDETLIKSLESLSDSSSDSLSDSLSDEKLNGPSDSLSDSLSDEKLNGPSDSLSDSLSDEKLNGPSDSLSDSLSDEKLNGPSDVEDLQRFVIDELEREQALYSPSLKKYIKSFDDNDFNSLAVQKSNREYILNYVKFYQMQSLNNQMQRLSAAKLQNYYSLFDTGVTEGKELDNLKKIYHEQLDNEQISLNVFNMAKSNLEVSYFKRKYDLYQELQYKLESYRELNTGNLETSDNSKLNEQKISDANILIDHLVNVKNSLNNVINPSNESAVKLRLKDSGSSIGYRAFMHKLVFEETLKRPLTGSSFRGVWTLFENKEGSTHSQYLDILFRVGVIGFIAYLYFIFHTTLFLFKKELGLFFGFSGLLTIGLFHETIKLSQGAFIFAFLLAMWDQQKNITKNNEGSN